MSSREEYNPGPASGAHIEKEGERWTLVLTRELRHPREKVWRALTDPEHLREWAPFDADRNLGTPGPVTLQTVGMPAEQIAETEVTRADEPRVLEYRWGENHLRWQLDELSEGTRLTLWHNIDRRFIAMGAAGWHVCLGVLDQLLSDRPIGRIVGQDALKYGDWQRLHKEYAEQFGVKEIGWDSE
jgi:uncharacterized protein YndB with AHSA1/START domain